MHESSQIEVNSSHGIQYFHRNESSVTGKGEMDAYCESLRLCLQFAGQKKSRRWLRLCNTFKIGLKTTLSRIANKQLKNRYVVLQWSPHQHRSPTTSEDVLSPTPSTHTYYSRNRSRNIYIYTQLCIRMYTWWHPLCELEGKHIFREVRVSQQFWVHCCEGPGMGLQPLLLDMNMDIHLA